MRKELEALTYELSKKYPLNKDLQEYFCKVADLVNKTTPPTADSMFEELGYEKSTNSAYAKYHKHNIKIAFVNDVNGKMVSGVPAIVTPQLHQAIHQKLIELGWIK